MWLWMQCWWENRFPRKPLPMVGLIGLLTDEQKKKLGVESFRSKEPIIIEDEDGCYRIGDKREPE